MKVIVDDCWGNHDELELEPHVTLRGLLKDMPTKTQFSPIDPKTGELYSFLQVLVKRRDCYALGQRLRSVAVWLLSSLDELVKAAVALLEPVLHKAEPKKHIYCIIHGSTRYEYVSLEEPMPPGESSS